MDRKQCLLITTLVFSIMTFALVLVMFIQFNFLKPHKMKKWKKMKRLYQEFDRTTNTSTQKEIFISRPMNPDDIIQYPIGDSKYVVISPLYSTQFECHGTCSCVPEERRSVASAKSLLYFTISAISVTMALSVSKNAFREQCYNLMEDECKENEEVRIEEQACFTDERIVNEELDLEDEWDCVGWCRYEKDMDPPSETKFSSWLVGKYNDNMKKICEDVYHDKYVELPHSTPLEEVEKYFRTQDLDPFCRQFHDVKEWPDMFDARDKIRKERGLFEEGLWMDNIESGFEWRKSDCFGGVVDEKNIKCVKD